MLTASTLEKMLYAVLPHRLHTPASDARAAVTALRMWAAWRVLGGKESSFAMPYLAKARFMKSPSLCLWT